MEGTGTPEYAKCVDISTKAALKEMILPGLLTITTPVLIGLIFGAEPLGGYMAGVCVSGVMWAIFQNNAGGAWDNAKKSFEAGVEINGEMVYKGSDAHKAAVTGDTVGDPFKDTSGPSMNILIKLTCLVGLVIAPILGSHSSEADTTETMKVWIDEEGNKHMIKGDKEMMFSNEDIDEVGDQITKEVKVDIQENEDGSSKAIVTTTTTENGKSKTEEQVFEGTMEEIKEKINAMKDVEVKVEDGKKIIEKEVEEVIEN
jgi:K(+)-stimulated pyrophosphate-energized sodium pump